MLDLRLGDSVLFCTDGLTEARNAADQEFDITGVQRACCNHQGPAGLALLGHVFRTVQSFMSDCPQWDDLTAAIFHFVG